MKSFFQKLLALFFKQEPKPEPVKKVAICVGHSRINDSGAKSVGGVSEWEFNHAVAIFLNEKLKERGIASEVINEYPFKTYGKSMDWVRERTWGFDVAIELHFNSYTSTSAKGFEYLYYHGSKSGEKLAKAFADAHEAAIPAQNNRGAKMVRVGERGYKFLIKTEPTAIICEPFFGSNPGEWVLFDGNQEVLADVYANALKNYFAV